MSSPTSRSLEQLRALGYQTRVVEKTIPRTFIKQHCFGVDILALKAGAPVLVVQATSGSNHAHRRLKLEADGFATLWKSAGCVLEVWSWSKAGPRGARKVWTLRREAL